MVARWLFVAIAALTLEQILAISASLNAIREATLPTCSNLAQYEKGAWCPSGKPCPPPIGSDATSSDTSALRRQAENTGAVQPQPTIVYTQTTNQDSNDPTMVPVIVLIGSLPQIVSSFLDQVF